ncbi:MAG: UbiX family flavin prenyltransferase [Sphingobacteriales bacterium]|nr:MAG: UbiX family flavin prenyltransferase [Sphingobacteriales bacterium]
MKRKIVVAVTGASGSIYTKVLFDRLLPLIQAGQLQNVGVVMSENAVTVWEYELNNQTYRDYPFAFYKKGDFFAPFASGSAKYDTMLVCPCSMGTMGRIAQGISDDLITRAADVMLKERRRLILMVRDAPYGLIQINNMKTITEAGGIICPASPSFYSRPATFEALAATIIDRMLDLSGFDLATFRWNDSPTLI